MTPHSEGIKESWRAASHKLALLIWILFATIFLATGIVRLIEDSFGEGVFLLFASSYYTWLAVMRVYGGSRA